MQFSHWALMLCPGITLKKEDDSEAPTGSVHRSDHNMEPAGIIRDMIEASLIPAKDSQALHYVAGYVVFKLAGKVSYLGYNPIHDSGSSSWISRITFGGLMEPTSSWLEDARKLEAEFLEHHGNGIRRGDNIINALISALQKYPQMHSLATRCHIRTRTFLRMRFLNRESSERARERRRTKMKILSSS